MVWNHDSAATGKSIGSCGFRENHAEVVIG
jgi:hypothetical protein